MARPQRDTKDLSAVIIGGGIAGLLLAVGLKNKLGINATVIEGAQQFHNVGGAMGLYPNGLRVIRDISGSLHATLLREGVPFEYRRWMRHDGSEVAVASETALVDFASPEEETALRSLGIRRWRLQKSLLNAARDLGITVIFATRVSRIEDLPGDTKGTFENGARVFLKDGMTLDVDLLFGADGLRSAVRTNLFGDVTNPEYTGVTCLMGSADMPRPAPGICFPSSSTTKCHACFYPTAQNEQVFQIFISGPEKAETWGPLSPEEAKVEREALAEKFRIDGWHPQFYEPLRNAVTLIRQGLRAREPIPTWHMGHVVLLGDAAHPPVPYIGQGANMAIEDVGVLLALLERLCCTPTQQFDLGKLPTAFQLYEKLRIPRTTGMHRSSTAIGLRQLQRAQVSDEERQIQESSLVDEVKKNGTLPILWPGARYLYTKEVDAAVEEFSASKTNEK